MDAACRCENGHSKSDVEVIMNEKLFETPILFLIFNRPDTTQKVFDQIKLMKPAKLYVGADGPRVNKEGEAELCRQTRDILQQIDWECELHTLFRERNLGCDLAVCSEINWFFENENDGIILEDDCVPNQDFFYFCQKMLEKYRSNTKVMMIGGFNPTPIFDSQYDYYFSSWSSSWGWATWKRAWSLLKETISDWNTFKQTVLSNPSLSTYPEFRELVLCDFRGYYHHPHEFPWDGKWANTILLYNGVCIIPTKNLIMNIGVDGVHYSSKSYSLLLNHPTESIDYSILSDPESIIPDIIKDKDRLILLSGSKKQQLILKISALLRRWSIVIDDMHPLMIARKVMRR